jgi:hypothetical protein
MTEAQWWDCCDPLLILDSLRRKASARKLRLFAVACCRRIWLQLDDQSQMAVDVAERFADGLATDVELAAARKTAGDAIGGSWATYGSRGRVTAKAARLVAFAATVVHATQSAKEVLRGDNTDECNLLRDIFPYSARRFTLPQLIQTWNDGTVVKIAQAIYDERAFDRMPILADALEDAGCDNADILRHCREPGAHVRGCWVIDLLLGKK